MLLTFSSEPFYTIRRLKNYSVYYGRIQYLGHVLLFLSGLCRCVAVYSGEWESRAAIVGSLDHILFVLGSRFLTVESRAVGSLVFKDVCY